jgi:SAM-dependent MidA family methyltransferase
MTEEHLAWGLDSELLPWSTAWEAAHFGPRGFYLREEAEDHFTTSPHVDAAVARALAELIHREYERRRSKAFTILDIGSGSGHLLRQLRDLLPADIEMAGVDVRPRPGDLPSDIDWIQALISSDCLQITDNDGSITGVLIAHEFLDDVPCDVVELDDELQPHVVLVDPVTGVEEIGPPLSDPACARFVAEPDACAEWLAAWWPPTRPLARREIGLTRDRMWLRLRRILQSGIAVAIDYGHHYEDRRRGVWDGGTLKGFAAGRPRSPQPDGSCNITAHVALDACASECARLGHQANVVDTTSITAFPGALGSFDWLVDPVMER